ncbi:MAG: hypothetical protein EBY39_02945 [Flavobacteriia bacterium]|nr:hypothetical protein [Flavobacteriia bacterium]
MLSQSRHILCFFFSNYFLCLIFIVFFINIAEMDDIPIELENEARLKFGESHDFFRRAGKELRNIYENRPIGRDVIIVGNSNTLLNEKKGKIIDSFPNVCRLNDWLVRGVKHVPEIHEYTGTKITHWVSGIGSQIPLWSKNRPLGGKKTIFLLPVDAFARMRAWAMYYCNINPSMFNAVPYIKLSCLERLGYDPKTQKVWNDVYSNDLYDTRDNVTFVPEYVSREIAANTVDYPSTGIAAIAYFRFILNMNVYTTGFSFFQNGSRHYYDEEALSTWHGHLHEFDGEAKVYKDWIDQGLIREI